MGELTQDNANGINLQVGIGGSTASSETRTHDETSEGSAIRSQGDVTIAATGGDLNIVGSTVGGNNVALAAAHDLNIESQAEHHTLKSDNRNASGGVGLQIGTDGIGFYAEASVGKGNAHGNGATHVESHIDASDTLSLIAGNDATLKGAQLTGHTILANVGHDLNVVSEQDTDDYASQQWQVGGKVVVGMGASASGSASYGKTDSHYASVNEVTGLQAGAGGYQVHVGGTTHLVGGQLASTASPDKNVLDTGRLIAESLHNESKYSAVSVSVSGGSGGAGFGGGLSSQHHDASSDTVSGVAAGTVIVRDGQAVGDLNRSQSTLDGNGIKNGFDAQKVADQQELGQVAGYVGMRSVGALAGYMADHATTEAERKAWSEGGTNKVLLHGLVGAATAALGGGNAAQGALGASASEAASGAMADYLANHGIDPNGAQGKVLMELASTVIGGTVGGASGASTALQGEQYNRQLHPDEIKIIDGHAEDFAKKLYGDNPTPDQIKDADSRLLAQANRDVNGHNDGLMDAAAESYINGLTAQYGGQTLPSGQHYFYALGDDYFNDALYADTLNTPGGQAAYQYQIAQSHVGVPYPYPNEGQFHQVLSEQNALTTATNAGAALQAGLVLCGASDGALCAGLEAWASGSSLYAGAKQIKQGHSTGWVGVSGGVLGLGGLAYGRIVPLLPIGAKAAAVLNADGTLTLVGDSGSLNAVSDFEQLAKGVPVTPTPGGFINQAKVCGSQCVLNVADAQDQALLTRIAREGDPTGGLTESLVNSVAKKQGMKVLDGGKYAGNKGFDAVLQNSDGTVTILIDAKQMMNGAFSLGRTADDSLQLSAKWIDQVMDKIDETSPAYKAIEQARDSGTLNTAVIGVNKKTGQLIGVPVNVPSPH
ncbi:hypothetical protein BV497_13675 [Fulvimonas soli]|nr:hypothetical protein BV497_13675 [Fulvimonas soli]